ncbi:MAG: Rab family GTPase [Candidatus Thorarchaeota archaeon]
MGRKRGHWMRAPQTTIFKTVLVGDGGVGKTSIAVRYTEDRFDEHMKMTIGVNFASKNVEIAGSEVTMLLWDLGGQPRFQDVVDGYFRGSRMGIAVYEVTRPFTLYRLDSWISRLRDNVPNCPIIIVGNKIDERVEGEGVTDEETREYASKYRSILFEVSAKTGEGVADLFDAVARLLAKEYLET